MRFTYADPPYIGQAKRHYGAHPDYAGEVDHAELIARLDAENHGWALSLSMKSLQQILALCPENVMVLSWVKPISPPMGDKRIYSWEPVIVSPLRRPVAPTRTHLIASPPQFTFRETPEGHVIGEKPLDFCHWLFAAAGLEPDDEFHDLYPGSRAVQEAWDAWPGPDEQPAPAEPGLSRWLGGATAKVSRPSLAELTAAGYTVVPTDTADQINVHLTDALALAARSTPLPTETCDPNVNPWDCTACKHTEDHPPAPLPTEQADGERWIGGGDQCPDGYEVRGINGSWYDAIDWNNDTYNDGEVIDWVRFPLRRTPDLTPADPEIAAEG